MHRGSVVHVAACSAAVYSTHRWSNRHFPALSASTSCLNLHILTMQWYYLYLFPHFPTGTLPATLALVHYIAALSQLQTNVRGMYALLQYIFFHADTFTHLQFMFAMFPPLIRLHCLPSPCSLPPTSSSEGEQAPWVLLGNTRCEGLRL